MSLFLSIEFSQVLAYLLNGLFAEVLYVSYIAIPCVLK